MTGRLRHPRLAVALGVLVLAPVLATVVNAAIPSGDGTIHACYRIYTGEVRIVDHSLSPACGAGERALSWTSAKLLTGDVQPTGSVGDVGDLYIDLNNKVIWGPKTSSGWGTGASLRGDPGAAAELERVSTTIGVTANNPGGTTVPCPAGKKVTGGGVSSQEFPVLHSYPTEQLDGWTAGIRNTSASVVQIEVFAVCVNAS